MNRRRGTGPSLFAHRMRMLRDESHSTAAGKSHVITEKTKKKKKKVNLLFFLSLLSGFIRPGTPWSSCTMTFLCSCCVTFFPSLCCCADPSEARKYNERLESLVAYPRTWSCDCLSLQKRKGAQKVVHVEINITVNFWYGHLDAREGILNIVWCNRLQMLFAMIGIKDNLRKSQPKKDKG